MLSRNYKALFSLRLLKSILTNFVDVFLVLYFINVSNNNILPLGIYKLVAMVTVWLVIFLSRNYCKSKNRVWIMRIGIVMYFIYFLAIILLKEQVVNYIYLIGLLYGLEEGFYYSVYNTIESDGIENKDREKYLGTYNGCKNIVSIIFPLFFGSLIQNSGFINTVIFVLVIVTLEIILSIILKDNNIPKGNKTNLKEFRKGMKEHPQLKSIIQTNICSGLTYSDGALSYVITIYIIKVFSESISLGIFTSIFSITSIIIGFLFVKIIKPEYYIKLLSATLPITIILLCIMLLNCNFVTVVLYNLFQTISKLLSDLIRERNIFNFSNIESIKREYKVEYFLTLETALFVGRVISNTLFILMVFLDANFIMAIFVIFVILQAISVIKLQFDMNKCNDVN
ncbi:MAG: MFS transporter [bacterium]|nr:MFS transporter [bacterium]